MNIELEHHQIGLLIGLLDKEITDVENAVEECKTQYIKDTLSSGLTQLEYLKTELTSYGRLR